MAVADCNFFKSYGENKMPGYIVFPSSNVEAFHAALIPSWDCPPFTHIVGIVRSDSRGAKGDGQRPSARYLTIHDMNREMGRFRFTSEDTRHGDTSARIAQRFDL